MGDGHHHHHHDHPHPPQEELDAIDAFIANPTLEHFCGVIHNIYSPVDLLDHNEQFREAVNNLGVYLVWGTHAHHHAKHAYVLRFDKDQGCTYTIFTNHDLDEIDFTFSWENYDLFAEELSYKIGPMQG